MRSAAASSGQGARRLLEQLDHLGSAWPIALGRCAKPSAAAASRGPCRAGARVLRRGQVAAARALETERARLRGAERDAQLRGRRRVGVAIELERGERARVPVRGALEVVESLRVPGYRLRERARARGLDQRRRFAGVVGALGGGVRRRSRVPAAPPRCARAAPGGPRREARARRRAPRGSARARSASRSANDESDDRAARRPPARAAARRGRATRPAGSAPAGRARARRRSPPRSTARRPRPPRVAAASAAGGAGCRAEAATPTPTRRAVSPSRPRASSERKLSPSSSGLPLVCRSSAASSGGSARAPSCARTKSRTSSPCRPASGQRSSTRSRSRRWSARAACGARVGLVLAARDHDRDAAAVSSVWPTNSSSASDSAPATCRSSRKSASGRDGCAAGEQRLHGLEELRTRRTDSSPGVERRASPARRRAPGRSGESAVRCARGSAASASGTSCARPRRVRVQPSTTERPLRLARPSRLPRPRAARARPEARRCASCRCRPLRRGTESGRGRRAPRRASPRRARQISTADVALGRGVSGDRSVAHAHGLRKAVAAARNRGDHRRIGRRDLRPPAAPG